METRTQYAFDDAEQKAIAESSVDSPLNEIVAGSLSAESWTGDMVLVTWNGLRVVPRVDLEAIISNVAAEREHSQTDGLPIQQNRSE